MLLSECHVMMDSHTSSMNLVRLNGSLTFVETWANAECCCLLWACHKWQWADLESFSFLFSASAISVKGSGSCPENPRVGVNFTRLSPGAIGGVALHLSIECWVPVTGCKAVGWQIQGCRKSGVIWQGGSAGAPMIWGPWGVIPPVEFPGFPEELVVTPVMIVASCLGTPAAQRRAASFAMTGRLEWMATKIWAFSSCAHISFLFWRRRSFLFWNHKEKGYISQETGLLAGRKIHASGRRGEEVTYKHNGIFHLLSQHRFWGNVLLIQHFDAVVEVAFLLIYLSSILPLGFGAHQKGKGYRRPASLQLTWVCGKLPSWQLFKFGSQFPYSFFLYSVRHVERVRRRQFRWPTPVRVS